MSAMACHPVHEAPLILVVEDEFLVRCLCVDILRAAGYRVMEADSGDEAREILIGGAKVDLVFSDVRMPGSMDGLQLLRWMRVDFPRIGVILCSGHLDPAEALACGAAAFVAKPFRVDEIVHRINACLDAGGGAGEPRLS